MLQDGGGGMAAVIDDERIWTDPQSLVEGTEDVFPKFRLEQLVPYATARNHRGRGLLCIGLLSASSPVAIHSGSGHPKARIMLGLGQVEARLILELNTSARRAGFGIVTNARC